MGREWVRLNEEIEEGLRIGSCVSIWATWAMYLRFSSRLEIESDRDKISLDCFPSLRTTNMYPMVFVKRGISSRLQSTTLGASPPLILGFHPSKCHVALIASCDQGSVVLAFTLVLLVLKRFWWRVVLVILIFVALILVDSSCFIAYHLRISCYLCASHVLILY